jgi:hypothetical protein
MKQDPPADKIDPHLGQDQDQLKKQDQIDKLHILVGDTEIHHGLEEERKYKLDDATQ